MSLVLNGGIGGSASTDFAYIPSRVATTLPVVACVWYRTGINGSAGGRSINWVQSGAAVGTYHMGIGHSQSVGPFFADSVKVTETSSSSVSVQTRTDLTDGRYAYPITSITTGPTTTVGFDALGDSAPFAVGMYVRASGTLTGVTGFVVSREYRVASVSGSTVELEVASSGAPTEGWTGTLRWSAWQPERWNLSVIRFNSTATPVARNEYKSGFLGGPGISMTSNNNSTVNPSTIWGAIDRVCIGGQYQSATGSFQFRGEIAHVAIWEGVDVDDSKAGELLTVAPNLVSWGTPLAYLPFTSDANDTIASYHATLVGTPPINSDGPSITLTGGGGGSGYLPTVMRAQPINLFGF